MTAQKLFIISLCIGALGLALWAGALLWQLRRSAKASGRVEEVLQTRKDNAQQASNNALTGIMGTDRNPFSSGSRPIQTGSDPLADELTANLKPPAWLETGWARALLADEDRQLLDQAGIPLRKGSPIYIATRAILAIALPLLGLLLVAPQGLMKVVLTIFFGFALGVMLPKWYMRIRANNRREQMLEEMPLFIDLLRLLQGVGLSIDQSLHIMVNEFSNVLRIISGELALANQLYATGRSRESSFQRMINLSADEDMAAIVSLLVQVDKHGGAVQEPLKQFGIRLREKRQASFKEKIGQITVKMTAVMVLTLLPALMVITAGPGFMAVIRSLGKMSGG